MYMSKSGVILGSMSMYRVLLVLTLSHFLVGGSESGNLTSMMILDRSSSLGGFGNKGY